VFLLKNARTKRKDRKQEQKERKQEQKERNLGKKIRLENENNENKHKRKQEQEEPASEPASEPEPEPEPTEPESTEHKKSQATIRQIKCLSCNRYNEYCVTEREAARIQRNMCRECFLYTSTDKMPFLQEIQLCVFAYEKHS